MRNILSKEVLFVFDIWIKKEILLYVDVSGILYTVSIFSNFYSCSAIHACETLVIS